MRTVLLLIASLSCAAAERQVAVTIDDLPSAQAGKGGCEFDRLRAQTAKLLQPFRKRRVPLTAFVIGSNCASLSPSQRRQILDQWRQAGADLGNHTFSHPDLNSTPIAEYEDDILHGERALRETTGQPVRYFRSPMLRTGKTPADKVRLEKFLAGHGWRQAPVTFDNSDWMFAYIYQRALDQGDAELARKAAAEYVPYMESVIEFFERRSVEVVGREFPQVLLLHANRLNADFAPVLLEMLARRGYRFVTLDQALRDKAYQLPNDYAGPGGFSWIHRWSMTMKIAPKGEPDEPKWLVEAYRRARR